MNNKSFVKAIFLNFLDKFTDASVTCNSTAVEKLGRGLGGIFCSFRCDYHIGDNQSARLDNNWIMIDSLLLLIALY